MLLALREDCSGKGHCWPERSVCQRMTILMVAACKSFSHSSEDEFEILNFITQWDWSKPGMVTHAINANTRETEIGAPLWGLNQPGLHNECPVHQGYVAILKNRIINTIDLFFTFSVAFKGSWW